MNCCHWKHEIAAWWKRAFLPERVDALWVGKLLASLAAPLCILLFRPLGLDLRQSAVLAGVLLTITWWSANIVKKIPASLFLLLVFALFSGAGLPKVFAFPLSDTFPMLVVTYLFSQAIANAGILESLIEPLLCRFVRTPLRCLLAIIITFFLMIYVIPQPLARLIIVGTVFRCFLDKADLPVQTRSVLMYGVYLFYAVVNMSSKDADMIMNHVAAAFSETEITNTLWMRDMLLPTALTCGLIAVLFLFLFRGDLKGRRIAVPVRKDPPAFSRRQKLASAIIGAAVLLWMTSGLHGLDSTLVTLVAVVLLFAVGVLRRKDFGAIDVTTLVFLTAAFSIGGVMQACGAADKVFSLFRNVFPPALSLRYLLTMIAICMVLHLILGSNTTTLSVVVPGLILLCGRQVPQPVIVYAAILSVSFHAILPVHSVAMMIGASDGHFPPGYVTRFGLPATLLVYVVAAAVYIPYWHILGLL